MTDDLTVFWRNHARAKELFEELLARAERCAYDDDFLAVLAAYRAEAPASERADIFAAQYLLAHGDAAAACVCAERAFARRPVNYEVWKVLAPAYEALGRDLDALVVRAYCHNLYKDPLPPLRLTHTPMETALAYLSAALEDTTYAPMATYRAYQKDGAVHFHRDVFIGEPLPLPVPAGSDPFWVACYTDYGFLSEKSCLIDDVRHSLWFADCGHHDFTFHLQKAREARGTVNIDIADGQEVILPLAGTEHYQPITVETESLGARTTYLGKWAFSYYRLSAPTTLRTAGDAPIAVGTPIRLGHSPQRKRLVLNILVDALSWPVMRPRFAQDMPNIARFFGQGILFDQHFSTSEYTYPALPGIETGCYPHHTQIFNGYHYHRLAPDFITLAERMKDLGYHCASPMMMSDCTYSNIFRGYDQITQCSWNTHAFAGADRTIRYIKAFGEADLFLFLHVSDVHPYDAKGYKFNLPVETALPLADRLYEVQDGVASVRLPNAEIYQQQFLDGARNVDRAIGQLLSYIEENFDEDEYIVNLYSDHGVPIFSVNPETWVVDVTGEESTGATWMMRGAGIPRGVTADELTSSLDLYPTLGHLCGFPVNPDIDGNLPAAFGGTARDAVYTTSMYRGQTFKLAMRTHEHVLRLETKEFVDEDGTVDFAGCEPIIYQRGHDLYTAYIVDSAALRSFFYPRARAFLQGIANNGEFWPAMRAAHADWFSAKES